MIYPICTSGSEEQIAGNSNATNYKYMRPKEANIFENETVKFM